MAALTFGSRRGRAPRPLAVLAIALTLTAWCVSARADDDAAALERRVQAAFLYKFASYVEWPESAFPTPDTPMRIGVCDDEELATDLSELVAGRTVDGRRFQVVRLKPADDLASVHILYLGGDVAHRLPALLRDVSRVPVLVVTHDDGALAQGSMINFRLIDGHVRFEIALYAAERRGLKLSSRLLTVAQGVVRAPS